MVKPVDQLNLSPPAKRLPRSSINHVIYLTVFLNHELDYIILYYSINVKYTYTTKQQHLCNNNTDHHYNHSSKTLGNHLDNNILCSNNFHSNTCLPIFQYYTGSIKMNSTEDEFYRQLQQIRNEETSVTLVMF